MSDEELRALAENATPGPWACYGDHLVWPSEKGPAANDPIAGVNEAHEECAAYIAAASPDRILALLDRLARVEALAVDVWRVTPCGCGHRADLHTNPVYPDEVAICRGHVLCGCDWSFVRIVRANLTAALSEPTTRTTDPEESTR